MMVAWHEVPGKARSGIRPVGIGVICVSTGIDFFTGRGMYKVVNQGYASDRTLRDGSHGVARPGTSCQATIVAVPPGQNHDDSPLRRRKPLLTVPPIHGGLNPVF